MVKHLTINEVGRLLKVIDNAEDMMLIKFGLETGCRVSEAVGVLIENIDFENQIIKIWDEKKNKEREIIAPKSMLQMIKTVLAKRINSGSRLFDFTYKTANRKVKKWCLRAGIPGEKAHWHTLRHSYIVLSRLAKRDFKVVQQNTGDSEVTLLRIYSELTPEERIKETEDKPII